jgi:hypothetical protein
MGDQDGGWGMQMGNGEVWNTGVISFYFYFIIIRIHRNPRREQEFGRRVILTSGPQQRTSRGYLLLDINRGFTHSIPSINIY